MKNSNDPVKDTEKPATAKEASEDVIVADIPEDSVGEDFVRGIKQRSTIREIHNVAFAIIK